MSQRGFFDYEERLERLSDIGDHLEGYAGAVDFEIFRSDLDKTLAYRSNLRTGGRPPHDPVMMFKILIIQAQHNLSDDRAEFLISERLSKAGAIDYLFAPFDAALREAGYISMSGQIVDATLVWAPKKRNSDGGKQAIKEGSAAEEIWPDQPAKAAQKDTDAAKHDGRMLRRGLLCARNTGAGVWADILYNIRRLVQIQRAGARLNPGNYYAVCTSSQPLYGEAALDQRTGSKPNVWWVPSNQP